MNYFAYGSNLDLVQMAERCPGAVLLGTARLAGHRLCFPRRSLVRGCAVASIEPLEGNMVWGAVYELGTEDIRNLDAREGYDPLAASAVNHYERVEVLVEMVSAERVTAETYIAVNEEYPGRPSPRYMKHIIDGALAHSFPESYVRMLQAVEVLAETRA